MDVRLGRHFWKTAEQIAEIRVKAPHQHIRQVIDRSFSLSALDVKGAEEAARRAEKLGDQKNIELAESERKHRTRNLAWLHAVICREARKIDGDVLVVAQKRVRESLEALGWMPGNVVWTHHNASRGLNDWRHVRGMIVIGRTVPSTDTLRKMAEALTGTAMPELTYVRRPAWREMTDGTFQQAETMMVDEPIAEALRWQVCEGELVQIIGRARGNRRTAADPVDILVLTDVPLPMPVESTIRAADLDPSPSDRMMAAGGIAFTSPTHAFAAFPNLWPSVAATKKALARAKSGTSPYNKSIIRESPHLRRVHYQVAGQGQSATEALFDPALIPDPTAFLAEKLGTLAMCEVEPPPIPAARAPSPTAKVEVEVPEFSVSPWHPVSPEVMQRLAAGQRTLRMPIDGGMRLDKPLTTWPPPWPS